MELPKQSDHFHIISPAASPEIWTWPYIAYSDKKMIILTILATSLIFSSLKVWENVLFELGS